MNKEVESNLEQVNQGLEMNFEQAIEELEVIAQALESGKLSLDDSIRKFEDGMKLSKKCTDYLENAEKRINILIANKGEVVEENFEK